MSAKDDRKDRANDITRKLLETGWEKVLVGTTVVYQKPAPVREMENSKKGKTQEKGKNR